MLSSAWESEQRQFGMVDWSNPKNSWMKPEIRSKVQDFQTNQVDEEFARAVEEHRIEEVYWVGGEPLMYEQHWRYMKRIIELGDGPNVYARYNTNLSRVRYQDTDLYRDILGRIRDWQICASIDGTGSIGEYIRTGLDYNSWLENFRRGIEIQTNPRQMRLDFTLTLPGLFEVENMQNLSKQLGVGMLAKLVFSFTPDIILSPLALPRELLNSRVDQLTANLANGALRDVLLQMKNRPNFEEQWPDEYRAGLARGKARVLKLEQIRQDTLTLDKILQQDKEIYEWWQSVPSDSNSL
jgi:hypothetical protein